MLTFRTVNGLLLAGTCLCIYGTPAPLHHHHTTSTEHSSCNGQCANTETPVASTHTTGVPSDADRSTYGTLERVTGRRAELSVKLGKEAGAGLDRGGAGPEGIAPVTQAENGGSHDGRFGLSDAAGEDAWSQRREADTEAALGSSSEMGEILRQSAPASQISAGSERKPGAAQDRMDDALVTNPPVLTSSAGEKQGVTVLNTQRAAQFGSSASPTSSTQPQAYSPGGMAWGREGPEQEMNPWDEVDSRASQPSLVASPRGKEAETSRPSSMEPQDSASQTQRRTSLIGSPPSPISSSSSLSHLTTLQSAWSPEGVTLSTLPDLLIPDIGPELTPRQDGPESVWTEPLRQSEVDTAGPVSQDEATEGTMSSEALPLIFEPFDDVTPEGTGPAAAATLAPGGSEPLAAMATRGMPLSEANLDQLVAVDTDSDGPSHAPSLLLPDWTSPWQTSGAELPEPINPSGPSVAPPPADTETGLTGDPAERDADGIQNPGETPPPLVPSHSTIKNHSATTLSKAAHRPVSKSRSGLEKLESEEEPDEDEEDENTEESDEDESEEDLTETPKPASTRPPYSLIPPPPVWVQRNQGLMRSWMELIREKAGYVSGMLAPVGIGIAGALLIVGALYSIRMIHRKRKNSFKHQRRKVRQPEQPREPGASRQDQAMLLADSSEDEF